ncbi:YlzJ-like family protein [Natranaerobius thermophilus]|uniref:YlzJ-like protein n=1 Tax=Natranaerobius thermophilus (strain ATCC BAA-1301 / DSM 18059 / JW/NM-WN-LF) TaxID=457570 RepID=B2A3B5_NATTJ|nr:YlzJ-like family protein [Natranaerobius thermophilus]ACB85045.1 conserved hypothetical protein [Natranaerobius thermophilus JW/NM-WN-LF]
MLIYTPVALEEVLQGAENQTSDSQYHEINYNGKTLIVEPQSPFQGKIVRLISSDSNDYLNPNLQPGNLINYAAFQE